MKRNARGGLTVLAALFLAAMVWLPAARAQSKQPAPAATASVQAAPQAASPSQPETIKDFSLSPEKYRRAKDYSNRKYLHYFVGALWGFVALTLLLGLRVGPRCRNWVERRATKRIVQGLLYAPILLFLIALLALPADAWDQQLERAFGLSVQGWSSWTADWLKSLVLGLVIGTGLVLLLYAVIRRSPRRWWFYFWLAVLPVIVFLFFLSPLVIDPMFFTFEPLAAKQPALVAEMEKVVHRGGMTIPPERMFEMNASSKETGLNAYVTGFGASKRVVVWDTTIAKATIPQILFVFGHEMGHYVLLHIPKEMSIDALALLVLFYLGFRGVRWALGRWGIAWEIRGEDDWASFPALALTLYVLVFLASPVFNTVSRHFEHEADRYGLEVIHGLAPDPGQVAARYFQMSGEQNLADPDPSPFINFWLFDHPSRKERMDFAVNYDPWKKGEQPIYVK